MCGFAGQLTVDPAARPDGAAVAAMAATLRHRGPDDEGLHVGPGIALGFRRLSIIDIAGGHQPMASEDGAIRVVFNGEIYNHHELRRELEGRGHRFRTRSDTEVLVHGYREWGAGLPERLEGMFAFACWNAPERTLLLGRDRMGKKPLFLLEHGGSLWFASELKALRSVPGWTPALDPAAADIFFSHQCVPAPRTIWREARRLEPAHRLEVRGAGRRTERYWTPRFEPKHRGSLDDLAAELRELLDRAVRRRLESEVPLGAFLSGGVDSSAVVALMAGAQADPVRTYTIGFEEDAYDERPFARAVAERFGTDHHEHVVRPRLFEDLPAILAAYDEPFGDSSAVPSWYVAREAARDLTVVLNGDGADDVFAGYRLYDVGPIGRGLSRLPGAVRRPVERFLLGRLLDGAAGGGGRRRIRRTLMPLARSLARAGFLEARDKEALYRPELLAALEGDGFATHAGALRERAGDTGSLLDRMLAVDLEQYLAGDLLTKVDISTMAHSLEARSPFLDREVVEFGLRLPDEARVRGGTTKRVVKQAFADLLPAGIAARRKRGFSVPVNDWLSGELAPLMRQLLVEEARGVGELLRPAAVSRLVDEHLAGRGRHGRRLWLLMCFELWYRSEHP